MNNQFEAILKNLKIYVNEKEHSKNKKASFLYNCKKIDFTNIS